MIKVTFRVTFFRMNINNDISLLLSTKRGPDIFVMQYILATLFLQQEKEYFFFLEGIQVLMQMP